MYCGTFQCLYQRNFLGRPGSLSGVSIQGLYPGSLSGVSIQDLYPRSLSFGRQAPPEGDFRDRGKRERKELRKKISARSKSIPVARRCLLTYTCTASVDCCICICSRTNTSSSLTFCFRKQYSLARIVLLRRASPLLTLAAAAGTQRARKLSCAPSLSRDYSPALCQLLLLHGRGVARLARPVPQALCSLF